MREERHLRGIRGLDVCSLFLVINRDLAAPIYLSRSLVSLPAFQHHQDERTSRGGCSERIGGGGDLQPMVAN